jgi:hypothetical protein
MPNQYHFIQMKSRNMLAAGVGICIEKNKDYVGRYTACVREQ